jgi:predicted regulator of Ras-like GTPase activity (Roadblock/LC7/MglB family)
MVKVGFICEGETEKLIIESEAFKILLLKAGLQLILAIDAEGNGNLLPQILKNLLLYWRIRVVKKYLSLQI